MPPVPNTSVGPVEKLPPANCTIGTLVAPTCAPTVFWLGGPDSGVPNDVPEKLPVQRASLLAADPLMSALGRPNREQVVTVRQGTATTLQALELTNGATLAASLKTAAEKILASAPKDSALLATTLYRQALSRGPTSAELASATQLLGSPVQAEGVQDLLWALAMLPEFQLIY